MTLAEQFAGIRDLNALTAAVVTCMCRGGRELSSVDLLREQAETKQRLVEEFGFEGERDFERFSSSHPRIATYAFKANVADNPDFATAAVRAYRASLNQ